VCFAATALRACFPRTPPAHTLKEAAIWRRKTRAKESAMSRAYRIKVAETLRRVVRASDHVSSQLEILEILPEGEMLRLLGEELERRGFRVGADLAIREEDGGITIEVDLKDGAVTVRAAGEEEVDLKAEKEGWSYEPQTRKQTSERLRDDARRELENKAEERTGELQQKVTDRLEGCLADLKTELDQAVNRVTAEALKRKAASMGRIKEIADDPESGSLTIVVEV
jgi:hypothetical protein